MTNKEKAQAAWAIACDTSRPMAERLAAQAELRAIKASAKTSFAKLGCEQKLIGTDLVIPGVDMVPQVELEQPDPLDEPVPVDDAAAELNANDPKPAKKAKEGDERGLISAEVRRLLRSGDMPYSEIEAAVRKAFPQARTTARSIASVASDLRGRGEKIAVRRTAAKAKA